MNDSQESFWFPAKGYGWGWGAPVKWQGWFAIAIYVGSLITVGAYFPPRRSTLMFVVLAGICTVAFASLVAFKGQKPMTWRWGNK